VIRAEAERLLELGWTKEELVQGKLLLANLKAFYDWGVVDGFGNIYYRGALELPLPHYSDEQAVCYTDGSGTQAHKGAGIGVYVVQSSGNLMIAEHIGLGSNNRAELCALWRGIRQFASKNKHILIRSDSEYAIGAVTQPWQANVNAKLIRCIREDLALRGDRVQFEHVDGHSGVDGNEIADYLAKIGRKHIRVTSYYPGE